jgi:hypothetical protein
VGGAKPDTLPMATPETTSHSTLTFTLDAMVDFDLFCLNFLYPLICCRSNDEVLDGFFG